ncbi:MAG: hypothetical protein IKX23_08160 [Treponema sp.]|nr:hypothetical protein [Treponema sp.]
MSEVTEGFNPIEHIRQVEKESQIIIENAKKEAEKKLIAARASCDKKFKEDYNQSVEKLQKQYLAKNATALQKYNDQLEEYKQSLSQKVQDRQEFNSFLTKSLF